MNVKNLSISKDADELSRQAAGWLITYIEEVLLLRNRFTIALSGGSTPKKLYQLLASEAYRDRISWKQLHVFWGDERNVPFTDERNNAKMAFDTLLSHVPVPAKQVHRIPTNIDPRLSAEVYDQLLHHYFDKQLYTFDLVLLGLGDNAHTLSLFPGYEEVIVEKKDWVKAFYLDEQQMYRITLTAPVVNNAGRVAFLVTGTDKTPALQHVLTGEYRPALYPAQLIAPANGELYWFLDTNAASGLQTVV